MEIREAAKSAAKDLGYPDLKPEQQDIVETFVKGRDVFAVFPTGFGKSLCFACLPIVFDKLLGSVGEDFPDSDHERSGRYSTCQCLLLIFPSTRNKIIHCTLCNLT